LQNLLLVFDFGDFAAYISETSEKRQANSAPSEKILKSFCTVNQI